MIDWLSINCYKTFNCSSERERMNEWDFDSSCASEWVCSSFKYFVVFLSSLLSFLLPFFCHTSIHPLAALFIPPCRPCCVHEGVICVKCDVFLSGQLQVSITDGLWKQIKLHRNIEVKLDLICSEENVRSTRLWKHCCHYALQLLRSSECF